MTTTDTKPLPLAPIKARLAAATPGPWEFDECDEEVQCELKTICAFSEWEDDPCPGWGGQMRRYENAPANAAFIASARTDVPALLAEVERLRGVLREQVRECLEDSTDPSSAHFGGKAARALGWIGEDDLFPDVDVDHRAPHKENMRRAGEVYRRLAGEEEK